MFKRIAPCFFAIIIDALGFGLVYPVIATMFTVADSPVLPPDVSLATRHFYLGLGYMLYPLCMLFGASFMGDLSDSRGRRKVLLLCMAGIAVSFLCMGFGVYYDTLYLLFFGRALSGLMAGSQPIAQASIADISNERNKAFNMSLISLSYSFGLVIGPLVGGIMSDQNVASWFTFSTPFFISAFLATVAFLWLYFGFTETAPPAQKINFSLLRPIKIFIQAFRDKRVRFLSIVFFLMQIGFSLYFQFIIIHMRDVYHYSNLELGAVQGMLGIGFAIGLLLGMPFSLRKFTVDQIAFGALLLTGIFQLLATIIVNETLQWLFAIIVATFDIMAFSSLLTLFSDAVDKHQQGWVMGVSGAIMAIAWILTGLSSNLMSFTTPIVLIGIGGVCLISASLFFWLHYHKIHTA